MINMAAHKLAQLSFSVIRLKGSVKCNYLGGMLVATTGVNHHQSGSLLAYDLLIRTTRLEPLSQCFLTITAMFP